MDERLRKAVHIFFGIPILLIPLLPWWALLLIAVAALVHNIVLLPLYAKKIMRREFDKGIVYYPFSVFLLLVLLKGNLPLAAASWALLSFADGLASLAGGKHPLPWNPKKTLSGTGAFIIVGFALAPLSFFYVEKTLSWKVFLVIEGAVILTALFESLDLGFDDNLIVPFSFVVFFMALAGAKLHFGGGEKISLGISLVLFLLSYPFGFFDLAGGLSALVVGGGMAVFGGWRLFLLLLGFLLLSEAASLYRKGEKPGFKRGASSVLGKGGPALLFSFLGLPHAVALALAEATFDTVATEMGLLSGGSGINIRTFRRGRAGQEGVWTWKGTLWGLASSLVLLALGWFLGIRTAPLLASSAILLSNMAEAHFKPCTTHSFANFLSSLLAGSLYLVLKF